MVGGEGSRRGDVHWIELPGVGGHAIRGRRPVLVVQSDRLRRSSTVIVLPMTTRARAATFRPPFLVEARARDTGLRKNGWIKCDQPFTVPSSALGPAAGRLDEATLDRVDVALRFVLDVRPDPRRDSPRPGPGLPGGSLTTER